MSSISPDIVTDGLVLCFDAADKKSYAGSGTTWTDRAGNKNGTLINGPTHSTDNGGLLSFDGVNDYVTIGGDNDDNAWTADNSVGSDILCLEIWFKGSDSGGGRVISKAWNGNGRYNISVYPDWFILLVGTGVENASDESSGISLPDINDGEWHQLVVWANSTNMGYYFDGGSSSDSQAHGLTGGISNKGNTDKPLGLMTTYFYGEGWAGNTGHAFEGEVGAFRKYNKVLTAEEVLQNFNAMRGRFGV